MHHHPDVRADLHQAPVVMMGSRSPDVCILMCNIRDRCKMIPWQPRNILTVTANPQHALPGCWLTSHAKRCITADVHLVISQVPASHMHTTVPIDHDTQSAMWPIPTRIKPVSCRFLLTSNQSAVPILYAYLKQVQCCQHQLFYDGSLLFLTIKCSVPDVP